MVRLERTDSQEALPAFHLCITSGAPTGSQPHPQLNPQLCVCLTVAGWDTGMPQAFLTQCLLSWSSLWSELHFVIPVLQALRHPTLQLPQEPVLELVQSRIRTQTGRFIWPQNHKLSITPNGPQQDGQK